MLLGMSWEVALYICIHNAPLGLRSAANIVHAVAERIEWCARQKGIVFLFLDNFLAMASLHLIIVHIISRLPASAIQRFRHLSSNGEARDPTMRILFSIKDRNSLTSKTACLKLLNQKMLVKFWVRRKSCYKEGLQFQQFWVRRKSCFKEGLQFQQFWVRRKSCYKEGLQFQQFWVRRKSCFKEGLQPQQFWVRRKSCYKEGLQFQQFWVRRKSCYKEGLQFQQFWVRRKSCYKEGLQPQQEDSSMPPKYSKKNLEKIFRNDEGDREETPILHPTHHLLPIRLHVMVHIPRMVE